MDRLTVSAKPMPSETFCFCQLCGCTGKDIASFEMIQECDDFDHPEPGNFLVRCKGKSCWNIVENHPRLYMVVPWSNGGAGAFMLTCGNCKHRDGFSCRSPELKSNGGPGLHVTITRPFNMIHHLSYTDITKPNTEHLGIRPPVTACSSYTKRG